MLQILPDDQITKDINSLNQKQREVFNVVHTWAKDYELYAGHDVVPMHIFLSGSRWTGKFYFLKVMYNAISKILLYHCKVLKKPKVILLGPTGISFLVLESTQEQSYLA